MAGLFGPGHPSFRRRRGRSKIASAAAGSPMDGRDKKEPGHDGHKNGRIDQIKIRPNPFTGR
jgi:hypothetical protein